MRTIHIAVACLVLMTGVAAAQEIQQAAKSSSAATSTSPALEAKVRKVWEDFKNKNKESLGQALADSFREIEEGASGFGDKKAELGMVDEFELQSYTLKNFTVKPLGASAALVTYSAQYEGKSGGEVSKSNSIFGEVWVREGASWKALYIQETAVK